MPKAIDKFKKAIEGFVSSIDPSKPFDLSKLSSKWNEIWPSLRSALEIVKDHKLSGDKLDKAIVEVIELGDKVSDSKSLKACLAKLVPVLKKVRMAIELACVFFPKLKKEVKLARFIEILHWIEKGMK